MASSTHASPPNTTSPITPPPQDNLNLTKNKESHSPLIAPWSLPPIPSLIPNPTFQSQMQNNINANPNAPLSTFSGSFSPISTPFPQPQSSDFSGTEDLWASYQEFLRSLKGMEMALATLPRVIPNPLGFDTTGQSAPAGKKPRLTATLWEDEGTLCFEVVVDGVTVSRREDSHMINGTALLNLSTLSPHARDEILATKSLRREVRTGPGSLQGIWILFEHALDLANQHKITPLLYPLFVHNIGALLYHPSNQARYEAVMDAAEKRAREQCLISGEGEDMNKEGKRGKEGVCHNYEIRSGEVVGGFSEEVDGTSKRGGSGVEELSIKTAEYTSDFSWWGTPVKKTIVPSSSVACFEMEGVERGGYGDEDGDEDIPYDAFLRIHISAKTAGE